MRPEVTVIISTCNGVCRLPAILRRLTAQDAADGSFEVIVVDNNSTDDSAAVASNDPWVAILCGKGTECRVIRELRRGVTFARIAGVRAARAQLICCLDDDNLPAADYIRVGASALQDPGIGLLISNITPQWVVLSNGVDALLPGPQPHARITGEDFEIGLFLGRAGYRRVYVPQLKLQHLIDQRRFGTAHFSRHVVQTIRSVRPSSRAMSYAALGWQSEYRLRGTRPFAHRLEAQWRCCALVAVPSHQTSPRTRRPVNAPVVRPPGLDLRRPQDTLSIIHLGRPRNRSHWLLSTCGAIPIECRDPSYLRHANPCRVPLCAPNGCGADSSPAGLAGGCLTG